MRKYSKKAYKELLEYEQSLSMENIVLKEYTPEEDLKTAPSDKDIAIIVGFYALIALAVVVTVVVL